MPDHLHLLDLSLDLERGLQGLAYLRRELISLCPGVAWDEIVPPSTIPDHAHLARQIRYVHLNPCRKGLCKDPLKWEWSTHRDYVGAVTRPWPEVSKILSRLRLDKEFHSYVSGDPTCHPAGTPVPLPVPRHLGAVDLLALERAAILATRLPTDAFRKKGRARSTLVAIARGLGVDAARAAAHFGIHRSSARRIAPKTHPWILPILRVLIEPRLLNPSNLKELT